MLRNARVFIIAFIMIASSLVLTACSGDGPGQWIENHILQSGEKLDSHIQESHDEQQSEARIENHLQDAGNQLKQHIEQSENRLESLTGKD